MLTQRWRLVGRSASHLYWIGLLLDRFCILEFGMQSNFLKTVLG